MSNTVTNEMAKMLDGTLVKKIPLGWGNISGSRYRFDNGVLIGLPHLSRFKIFNRAKSKEGLAILFDNV